MGLRKWRVGNVSMGLSLILLGIFLFVSQFRGAFVVEPFLIWWPIVLIVLGIEIIAYILLSKQENPVLKYDFISIFFVVIISTIGIAFTILTSTGVMKEIQLAIDSQEKTFQLPLLKEPVPQHIQKVVIDPGNQPVHIESSNSDHIHVFGTYRSTIMGDSSHVEGPIREVGDYVFMEKVSDTLYLVLKDPTVKKGIVHFNTQMETTIVVPDHILLEMRSDSHHTVDLYPGDLFNHSAN